MGLPFLLHRGQGIKEGKGGVAFGGRGQIETGFGQMKASFRQADIIKSLGRGCHHRQSLRVGQADILAGKNNHPAEDEAGILAGVNHFGQPIEGGVRVGAAQGFDEGGNGIKVGVAILVIQHRPALDRLLGHLCGDINHTVGVWRSGLDGQFQGIQHGPGVAISHVDQVVKSFIPQLDLEFAVTAALIRQRLPDNGPQIVFGQAAQLENAGAGHQRFVDFKIGIFRGGSHQDDRAIFYVRQ